MDSSSTNLERGPIGCSSRVYQIMSSALLVSQPAKLGCAAGACTGNGRTV